VQCFQIFEPKTTQIISNPLLVVMLWYGARHTDNTVRHRVVRHRVNTVPRTLTLGYQTMRRIVTHSTLALSSMLSPTCTILPALFPWVSWVDTWTVDRFLGGAFQGDEAISVEEDLRVASDAKRIAYMQVCQLTPVF
jgi:hypothetical protein